MRRCQRLLQFSGKFLPPTEPDRPEQALRLPPANPNAPNLANTPQPAGSANHDTQRLWYLGEVLAA